MQDIDSVEFYLNHTAHEVAVASCRSDLETLQNLRYLVTLEAEDASQVRLHARMMEWHLQNLSHALQAF